MNNVLLTKEVASILRVSPEHVRELIRSKEIRAYKEGRRGGYRILRDDVDEYILQKLRLQRMTAF